MKNVTQNNSFVNFSGHDPNNTVITASSPIFVEKGGNKAPAAVAGLQIKYNKLEELLMNVSHSVSNRFQEEQCRGRRNCRIKKSPMCESEVSPE